MDTVSSILFALLGSSITLFPLFVLIIWYRKKKSRRPNSSDLPKMNFFDDWVGGPDPSRSFDDGRPFPEQVDDNTGESWSTFKGKP